MSQIFYTEVDKNLQSELTARSLAGYNRTNRDINYMIAKVANVEIVAMTNPSGDATLLRLGGKQVRFSNYLPSGKNGFLNSDKLSEDINTINWTDQIKDYKQTYGGVEFAFSQKEPMPDVYKRPNVQQRIPPYIVSSEIAIGDHSMGLLNTATVIINIPNMQRDLDVIEQVFMRPGRRVKLTYAHPELAIITEGSLTNKVLPSDKKLQALYPGNVSDLRQKKQQIKKMNEIVFEGLIVNFDLSIQTDFTAQITLTLRGTSNVYTDVSMFINGSDEQDYNIAEQEIKSETRSKRPDFNRSPTFSGLSNPGLSNPFDQSTQFGINSSLTENNQTFLQQNASLPIDEKAFEIADEPVVVYNLYDALYDYINEIHEKNVMNDLGIKPTVNSKEFKHKVFSEEDQKKFDEEVTKFRLSPIKTTINTGNGAGPPPSQEEIDESVKSITDQWYLFGDGSGESTPDEEIPDNVDRYITLGTLIDFINTRVLTKLRSVVSSPNIICDDGVCFSNYFEQMCSIDPQNVLLLPADDKRGDVSDKSTTEKYGSRETGLIYFKDVFGTPNITSTPEQSVWKGYQSAVTISDIQSGTGTGLTTGVPIIKTRTEKLAHPSRIFLNLNLIKNLFYNTNEDGTTEGKNVNFKLNDFLISISDTIKEATCGVINMKLITHPDPTFDDILLYYDANFGGTLIDKNEVKPYSVPMTARIINKQTPVKGNTVPLKDEGDTIGSIVQDFSFTAKMPSSVSTLSYVLNQNPDEISEEDIAPYVNLMYQHGSKEQINKLKERYEKTHKKYTRELFKTKVKFGKNSEESKVNLIKALKNYIQFPLDKPEDSLKIMSPIFPFDASFTMDGINGLRYGDVLEFDILPTNYRVNTVFSIIGVTHTVSQEGEWKTAVKCIMRPRIGL